jgi:branched-chain amino acid transport system ATP-binding protein
LSLLSVRKLKVAYGRAVALRDISLNVEARTIVTLLGANGAGKTTALATIAGLIRPLAGTIQFEGIELTRMAAWEIVEAGLSLVPEHRQLFPEMTVDENLVMGAYTRGSRQDAVRRLPEIFDLFPELTVKRKQRASTLSGGQQQMLAIGRALMSRPRMLLLDEPSLGLAPKIIDRILDVIQAIHRSGVAVLLVEQNAYRTLPISDYSYVLDEGNIPVQGPAAQLLTDERIKHSYLGTL